MHTVQLWRFRMSIAVKQVRRYGGGNAQPSRDGMKKIALALHVSLEEVGFEANERGPKNSKLALLFKVVANLPGNAQSFAQAVLDWLIFKHRVNQLLGEVNS